MGKISKIFKQCMNIRINSKASGAMGKELKNLINIKVLINLKCFRHCSANQELTSGESTENIKYKVKIQKI